VLGFGVLKRTRDKLNA